MFFNYLKIPFSHSIISQVGHFYQDMKNGHCQQRNLSLPQGWQHNVQDLVQNETVGSLV